MATYLGYGANEAADSHRQSLMLRHATNSTKLLEDPCMQNGQSKPAVADKIKSSSAKGEVKSVQNGLVYQGTGDWDKCYEDVKEYVIAGEDCKKGGKCGGHRLTVPDAFLRDLRETQFYAFSEFWYTTEDIFRLGGRVDLGRLRSVAQVNDPRTQLV